MVPDVTPAESASEKLNAYLGRNGLKQTRQREAILDVFIEAGGHLTSEDLHQLVRERYPEVGVATVYRALKLFVEAGVAHASTFREGITVYEAEQEHHDHIVCVGCGRIVEFSNDEIERLQEVVAKEHGFRLTRHRHHLFGYCPECDHSDVG